MCEQAATDGVVSLATHTVGQSASDPLGNEETDKLEPKAGIDRPQIQCTVTEQI